MRDLGNKVIMARNIKRLMDEKDVSPKEMSKTLHFPYTTVLSWMKAENYPRIDKIEAMADYFGVLKSELIEEKLTPEKEKDNDLLAEIIVRMRMDEGFRDAVATLYQFDTEKINSIRSMLQAFAK